MVTLQKSPRIFIITTVAFAALIIFTVAFFSFSFFPTQTAKASGNTYYVSKAAGASDSNNGTAATYTSGTNGPWLTIHHAMLNAHAGDTVYIRGGSTANSPYTYQEPRGYDEQEGGYPDCGTLCFYNKDVTVHNNGSTGNPITYKGYPSDSNLPVIEGGVTVGSNYINPVTFSGSPHDIVLDSLDITGGPRGVEFISGHDIRILNSHIHDNTQMTGCNNNTAGIHMRPGSQDNVYNITIEYNTIHDNHDDAGCGVNQSGIHAYYMAGSNIDHNIIYNEVVGVYLKGDWTPGPNVVNFNNVAVFNNTIYDVNEGIKVGGQGGVTENVQVHHNLIYNFGGSDPNSNSGAGLELLPAAAPPSQAAQALNVVFYNNTVVNTLHKTPDTRFHYANYEDFAAYASDYGQHTNTNVYNNLFVDAFGIKNTNSNWTATNFQEDYNYFVDAAGGTDRTPPFTNTYYIWGANEWTLAQWRSNSAAATGNANGGHSTTATSVSFIDAAAHNYHLQVDSPACTAGQGNSYVGAFSCGATDTTPPTVSITAPTNSTTVSGTVAVSANASDDVGVVGVQFKLDGNNLGSEDLNAPYTINWDSTTATNASHTLTAVARDAAGNPTISASVTVTVLNTPADSTPPAAVTDLQAQ